MRIVKKSILFINLAIFLNTTGCGVFYGPVFNSSKPLFMDQQIALNQEPDYELAKTALPGNIKLLEGFMVSFPDDIDLKLWTCEALCGYAVGFVEDDDSHRASELYLRAKEYAVSAACRKAGLKSEFLYDPNRLKQWIDHVKKDNIGPLFWLGQSWGSWIAINLDNSDAIADLPKVEWIMERVLALDESYYHAGAHVFLGAVLGNLPVMLGGNLERSKQHFSRCFELTERKFLLAQYYFMKTYCVQAQDKKLFDEYNTEIENFDLNKAVDVKLINSVAKKRAKKLQELKKELFFDDNE